MNPADGLGLSLFGMAILIVLPLLIYSPLRAHMERREHQRRMSRAWREAPYGEKPKKRSRGSSASS